MWRRNLCSRAGRSAFWWLVRNRTTRKDVGVPRWRCCLRLRVFSSHRLLLRQRSISRGSFGSTFRRRRSGPRCCEFSEQAQLQVIVESRLAESVSAPTLKGEYTRGNALKVLLEGSGLTFRMVGNAAIAIHAAHSGADARETGSAGTAVQGLNAGAGVGEYFRRSERRSAAATRGRRARHAGEPGRDHRRRHPPPRPLRRRNTRADRSDSGGHGCCTSSGHFDVGQLLQFTAPSFNSNRQVGADGADHIDSATLRGLGPDQTLVLVNGKRQHSVALVNVYGSRARGNTGTDLNTIPALAIERIDVLRDGAAAQYGSDAIAGVINIGLKRSTALDVLAASGEYTRGDGRSSQLAANYGFGLGERGFMNLTAEYLAARPFESQRRSVPSASRDRRRRRGEPHAVRERRRRHRRDAAKSISMAACRIARETPARTTARGINPPCGLSDAHSSAQFGADVSEWLRAAHRHGRGRSLAHRRGPYEPGRLERGSERHAWPQPDGLRHRLDAECLDRQRRSHGRRPRDLAHLVRRRRLQLHAEHDRSRCHALLRRCDRRDQRRIRRRESPRDLRHPRRRARLLGRLRRSRRRQCRQPGISRLQARRRDRQESTRCGRLRGRRNADHGQVPARCRSSLRALQRLRRCADRQACVVIRDQRWTAAARIGERRLPGALAAAAVLQLHDHELRARRADRYRHRAERQSDRAGGGSSEPAAGEIAQRLAGIRVRAVQQCFDHARRLRGRCAGPHRSDPGNQHQRSHEPRDRIVAGGAGGDERRQSAVPGERRRYAHQGSWT